MRALSLILFEKDPSIVGLFNFITIAIQTDRAFLCRFYDAMSHAIKPFYVIYVNIVRNKNKYPRIVMV